MVRRSRKKRSSREDYPMSEQLKIEAGVFDNRTMMRLVKFFTKGVISRLEFITARGKEADVYIAEPGDRMEDVELVIVKIFRIETSSFQKRIPYIRGDPRFGKIKNNMYAIVNEWCKKEYGNLQVAAAAKVNAPKPYLFDGNVLAMEFIGDGGVPSPQLKNVELEDPEKTLDIILEEMKKLYASELVHGDISEYNILMKGKVPYLIDFGQAVMLQHPEAMNFLRRDVENILGYFSRKYGIERESVKAFDNIVAKVDGVK